MRSFCRVWANSKSGEVLRDVLRFLPLQGCLPYTTTIPIDEGDQCCIRLSARQVFLNDKAGYEIHRISEFPGIFSLPWWGSPPQPDCEFVVFKVIK